MAARWLLDVTVDVEVFYACLFFLSLFFLMIRLPPRSTRFPSATLFRSKAGAGLSAVARPPGKARSPVTAGAVVKAEAGVKAGSG